MPVIKVFRDADGQLTIEYPEGMTEEEALQRALSYIKQKEQ